MVPKRLKDKKRSVSNVSRNSKLTNKSARKQSLKVNSMDPPTQEALYHGPMTTVDGQEYQVYLLPQNQA